MKNNTLQNAFPIVAAAIGNRFGIKVSVGGDQAYTTGKAIQLPAYLGDDPDYQDYAWGLLAHESAHIRYSDFSLVIKGPALRRRLCGAIEDVRIEYALAQDFPGTKLTLRTVVDKMIATGGFAANTRDEHPATILYGYVLKSLRARVLGQSALQPLVELSEMALSTHFPKGAIIRLKGLLSEVPDGLSCERDCLQLTDQILIMIEQACQQASTAPASTKPSSTATAEDQNTETALADEDDSDLCDSETEAPSTQDTANDQSQSYGDMVETLLTAEDDDIEQDIFDAVKSTLSLATENTFNQVMPVGNEPPFNETAGCLLFQKVKSESVKIRTALQGWVQAQALQPSLPVCRGRRLDNRRLHRLALGDNRVFKSAVVKPSPNTAIHVLVDKSDSMNCPVTNTRGLPMGSRLPLALEACLALTLALEGIPGVNPGITAFPGEHDGAVYRLLEHGQRVGNRKGAFSLRPSGCTPMTEALWFGAAALLRCREPRKILMVITDGQPDDTLTALDILQRCRDSGIETVGIGLGIDVCHLFPVAITINELEELRTQLFTLSKSLLLTT